MRVYPNTRCLAHCPPSLLTSLHACADPMMCPGSLVWSHPIPPAPSPPPAPSAPQYVEGVVCDGSKAQTGFSYDASTQAIQWTPPAPSPQTMAVASPLCFDATDGANIQAVPCTGTTAQKWTFDAEKREYISALNKDCLDVYYFTGPRVDAYACNGGTNQQFTISSNGTMVSAGGRCLELTSTKPGGGPGPTGGNALQLWAKPVGQGAMAILLINSDATTNTTATVNLADLNMTGSVTRRDVWKHADAGPADSSFSVPVPAQDSVFMVLSPA
eukprot:m.111340 g.111340  ORF g.111340 m.111340 type:complete len:272 (+) comp10749_c0_seq5:1035-1850(+)